MSRMRFILFFPLVLGALALWIAPSLPAQEAASRIQSIKERLVKIERQASRIHDINEIENLQRAYGYYYDKMLWDEVIDLFTDDGQLEIGYSGVYIGKASIRCYLYSLSEGKKGPLKGVLFEHMQLQPIVTIDSDGRTAKGRWRAFILAGTHASGSGGTWGEGPCENQYVKDNGIWKIKKIHWFGTFIAPYETGWQYTDAEAVKKFSISKSCTPDRPTSEPYEPYPVFHIPPFHYKNPGRAE